MKTDNLKKLESVGQIWTFFTIRYSGIIGSILKKLLSFFHLEHFIKKFVHATSPYFEWKCLNDFPGFLLSTMSLQRLDKIYFEEVIANFQLEYFIKEFVHFILRFLWKFLKHQTLVACLLPYQDLYLVKSV